MNEYQNFLERKKKSHRPSGFKIDADALSNDLFPFQKFVVGRALVHGKYAVFSGTGTGKTRQQLVWSSEVANHTGKPVLILAPLAVSGQTILEGEKICIKVVRASFDKDNPNYAPIQIANYEQLENIDTSIYAGIAIDEASIMKNEEGAYRNLIIGLFINTEFKTVWTATPSPNDPTEIGNYSEFLGVMSRKEMLAMYFVHDGGATSEWRLKGHCQKIFWEWVSTWAIMFQSPKDIGFSNDGYDLPKLNLVEHQIVTDKKNNGLLFNDVAVSATTFNAELRVTAQQRLEQVAKIANENNESFIIWIKQNQEGDALRKLIPDAIEVKGDDSLEYKEEKLLGFAAGKYRVLITKTKIAGSGLNFQICHNQIFAAIDFSFESLFQGIRRSWRFGQKEQVNIFIITTDTMQNVIQSIKQKEIQFEIMQSEMTEAANKNLDDKKKTKIKREFKQHITEFADFQLGDSVQLIKNIPDESIGLSVFSPPFAELYTYSDELEDMGNSKDYKEFFYAFNFLVKDIFRIMWSGRNVAVHCMDLPIQKGKEGFIGLRDFSGMILRAFEEAGFIYHSRVTIWKNPVTEMQRTKALGLLHKQIKKDASMSRVGIPDYLLVFRKPGEHLHPIIHQDTDPTKPNYLPVDLWQKYASPVWYDIDYSKTLNGRDGRQEEDEKHIAPLQLETIERCVHLWSNEGDTVFTPFGGIGSELFQSIKMKRKAKGIELKQSYWEVGVQNCIAAEREKNANLLFSI